MSIELQIGESIKKAMLAREKERLEALRAIKSAFLLEKTSGKGVEEITDDNAIKIITKLVKQRNDSAQIYKEQNRPDLYESEVFEVRVLSEFLPQQLSEDQILIAVSNIIVKIGALGMKDMGKVMVVASKELAGKADGSLIAKIVKESLA